jgi:hypothetical protein
MPRRKYGRMQKPIPPVPREKCRLCRLKRPCPILPAASDPRSAEVAPILFVPAGPRPNHSSSRDCPDGAVGNAPAALRAVLQDLESCGRELHRIRGTYPRAESAQDADVGVYHDHGTRG